MVVKMMKWKPWLPQPSKKFEARIVIKRLEGLKLRSIGEFSRLAMEIKWKGFKGNGLRHLKKKKGARRNYTREEGLREDGVVEWNEEFQSFCSFSGSKDGAFHPWEVKFTIYNYSNQGPDRKPPALATVTINLTEFASADEGKDHVLNIPLSVLGSSIDCRLSYSISFLELNAKETSEPVEKPATPIPSSPSFVADGLTTEKAEPSPLKAGLQKVKKFTRYVSARRPKKSRQQEEGSDGKLSDRSEEVEYNYPFDTDSLDDVDDGESEETKEESVSQESLGYVNVSGSSFCPNTNGNELEDSVYYSNRKLDASSLDRQSSPKSSKKSIVQWRKRKLSFKRSPKPKGEPLLRKDHREEGGDDIDFVRRQLSSSDESGFGWNKTEEDSTTASGSSVSEFGDDNFAVGSWEKKEVVSRDGHMKLETQVFFASIDQRSERAAGESACTALVAVIADWFQSNQDLMPVKSQLDSLIREGSLEWRNLCENKTYMERFPDKHFDLDTVLQAKVRPLDVVPEKSFIGFFLPEGLEDVKGFDFLRGAMSFDSIWDEISHEGSENARYIVSWNDHFFVLNVEKDAYYIIDTLGERLYEGCNEAFVLKFDKDTIIRRVNEEKEASNEKSASEKKESGDGEDEELVLCSGKESCKEYIKSFLAAIPIRELQVDLKKGLVNSSTPLHHRLQIEFHYTQSSQCSDEVASVPATSAADEITSVPVTADDALAAMPAVVIG